jgi:hypothetical protein
MARETYFSKLKNIKYDMYLNNKPKLVKNIFHKSIVVDKFINDPNTHYEYTIKDGDSPQSLAELYYGNPNYYWVILMMNNIVNPQDEWPLSAALFDTFINKRYGGTPEAEKSREYYIHKVYDHIISIETYDRLVSRNDRSFEHYKMYSSYEKEFDKNEKNRVIRLLKKSVLDDFVKEFEKVMAI